MATISQEPVLGQEWAQGYIAHLRAQTGDVAGALKLHEERLSVFEQLGEVRNRAVTLGDIARLRAQAGDVPGALKLHEEKLGIMEQLGEVRERAVTLGDISHLRAQAGDMTEARRLNEEYLEIQRTLGDLGEISVALFNLAQIDLREEKFEDALSRLTESWSLINQAGRGDGIAIVGLFFGSLLAAAGQPQARDMLLSSKEAFLRLGMDSRASELEEIIQKLPSGDSSEPGTDDPPGPTGRQNGAQG